MARLPPTREASAEPPASVCGSGSPARSGNAPGGSAENSVRRNDSSDSGGKSAPGCGPWNEMTEAEACSTWIDVLSLNPMNGIGARLCRERSRWGSMRSVPYPPRSAQTARMEGSSKAACRSERRRASVPANSRWRSPAAGTRQAPTPAGGNGRQKRRCDRPPRDRRGPRARRARRRRARGDERRIRGGSRWDHVDDGRRGATRVRGPAVQGPPSEAAVPRVRSGRPGHRCVPVRLGARSCPAWTRTRPRRN